MAANDTAQALQRNSTAGRPTLSEQTGKVAEDVRELGNIALAGAGEAIDTLRTRGSEMVDGARERGQKLLDQGRERASAAREGFEGYVSDNPFKSVLIAAGIGALIGYSLRSRN